MNNQLIEILKKQKNTRDTILSQSFIPRHQLGELRELFDTSLIKVITGPRRAGKSTLIFLLLKNKNFIYINFEDGDLLKIYKNETDLIDCFKHVYGDTKIIFFDEIQNLPNWEMFLNKLLRNNYNIFTTGSNAKLLSGELATSLTGRHMALEVLPFSYQEYTTYLDLSPEKKTQSLSAQDFLLYNGGFPEVTLELIKPDFFNTYIEALVYSVLHKDILLRYLIKNPIYITLLVEYLIGNITNKLNYSSISLILNIKTYRTIVKYLSYIDNSYLFVFLSGFSFKTKKRITSNNKIYAIDNGILSYKNLFNTSSYGILFENLVFTELLKKGYKANSNLFYYSTKNDYEIDFILKKNTFDSPETLIQVCYDISDTKTEKREVRALLEASKELKCSNLIVITYDLLKETEIEGKTIKFVPFSDFAKYDFKI